MVLDRSTDPAGPGRWNAWTIVMHWLSAVLIVGLIGLGLYMVHGNVGAAARFNLYQLHKSIGFVALAVLLVRILLRWTTRAPAHGATVSRWEGPASGVVHAALYAVPLAEVLTGWLFVSSSIVPIPTRFFDLFVVPNLTGPGPILSSRMALLHLVGGWIIVALLACHVLAALKHHVVDRDDVLRRMV